MTTQPPEGTPEDSAERLALVLQRAYDDLAAAQRRVIDAQGDKLLTARRLDEFVEALVVFQEVFQAEAARFVRGDLPTIYARAAQAAIDGVPFSWTPFHVDAVTELARDTYEDLLRRSQEAGRVGATFVRAVRRAGREQVPSIPEGVTATEAGRAFQVELEDRYGISSVTYRNGAVHTAREYTQMIARSKTAVAMNLGALNRWSEYGVAYVEVFDGSQCGWRGHDDPDRANGSIRRASEAVAYPISHPNCRRAFGPRPDIRTAKDARTAQPTTTAAQRADQAQAEREQAERSAERRRAARAVRRADRAAG